MDWDEEQMPSRAAQHSSLGMTMGRKSISTDRQPILRKRHSHMKMAQVSPETDPEIVKALQRHGLSHLSVETDNDAHKALRIIRSIPKPMAFKRDIREILLKGDVKQTTHRGFRQTLKVKWRGFKDQWKEFRYSVEVWRSSMKRIEGHQGTAVMSYFVFLRSIFFLNIFMFLVLFWIITFFQVTFDNDGYDSSVLGDGEVTTDVATATTCSAAYAPDVKHDALSYILDFFQGTGWMEDTAMFYGFYTNEEVKLAASQYNMPLAYILTTIFLLLFSLVVMVRSTLSNFKETVLARENHSNVNYCNTTFAGMDFSVDEDIAMMQLQRSLYCSIKGDLDEQRYEQRCLKRSTSARCWLYTKRLAINFLIIILLAGAGAAIYYAQDFSSDFTTSKSKDDYSEFVFLLVEFLPGIVIGLFNGIYPIIFEALVTFEDYRPAFVIKINLVRAVFLKLASLTVVVVSLYIQITCSDQSTCDVGQNDCPAIQCWETYVGSAMYKLVVVDFIIDLGFILGVELPRKLITTKCDCGLAKKVGPAVFNIPTSVLDLVYGQTLCWLGFFFSPLLPAVCVVKLFLLFYLKYLSAQYNTVPPEKPYQASKLNSFFMIILMVAYFLMSVPIGYVLVSMDPSPMCGPFRIYGQPKDIIDIQINNAASWFQTVWEIVTSTGVVSALIILLILAVYYCSALNSAHKDLVELMKDQLVMEGKDKQFLLNKVNTMSGKPQNKPPTWQRSNLKTVDETQQMDDNNKQNGPLKSGGKAKQNGVTSVKYEKVKLYGEQHDASFVQSPMHIDAPSAADYADTPTINKRHPGPGPNEMPLYEDRSNYQGPDKTPLYENRGLSQASTQQQQRAGNDNTTRSASQVQQTGLDDW